MVGEDAFDGCDTQGAPRGVHQALYPVLTQARVQEVVIPVQVGEFRTDEVVGVGKELVARVQERPAGSGYLDIVDVPVGVREEVVVPERARRIRDGADRILDGPLGEGTAVEKEFGDANTRIARVEGIADRSQAGGVNALVQQIPGVGEGDKRGRGGRLRGDDVGVVSPSRGGVLVVPEQDVAIGCSCRCHANHRAAEPAGALLQFLRRVVRHQFREWNT